MSAFLKKQGIACYLNAIAAILGIAGLIAMIISSSISSAYALSSLPLLIFAAIAAIALIVIAIYAPNRWGNYDYISMFSRIGVIALFSFIIGKTLNDRILLISGLFSYNSGNTLGWSVFYTNVVAWGGFLAAILFLIIGLFLKSIREPKPVINEE